MRAASAARSLPSPATMSRVGPGTCANASIARSMRFTFSRRDTVSM